ncbi:nitroreductase family protein [Aquisphaera insulae]|uniref:nitroreductase family protein n=1 Tax=Aquisphaera insulae TaxID=2712864 RepID=UPI0013EA9BDE|nr:nitroreductase family protein [Aquisphaera insulae]
MTGPLASLHALDEWLRRGIPRGFADRPVAPDVLRQVLSLAAMAPSEFDLRPARFLVVREAGTRRAIRSAAYRHPLVAEAPVLVVVLGYLNPDLDGRDAPRGPELAGRIRTAMTPLGRAERAERAGRGGAVAAGILLVAAEAAGLAAAYIDNLDRAPLRLALGIPDDHVVCGIVAIGHPAARADFADPPGLDDVCFEEHFGQPWDPGA